MLVIHQVQHQVFNKFNKILKFKEHSHRINLFKTKEQLRCDL